jgi:hypothetical protein
MLGAIEVEYLPAVVVDQNKQYRIRKVTVITVKKPIPATTSR